MHTQAHNQPLTCGVCGSALEADDRFCRFCGASAVNLSHASPDQETRQAPIVTPAGDEEPETLDDQPAWLATDDDLWGSAADRPEPVVEELEVEEIIVSAEPESEAAPDRAPIFVSEATPSPPPSPPPFAPAAEPAPYTYTETPSSGGGNRTWWIIGGIIVLFAVICCCLSFGIVLVASADSALHEELRGFASLLSGRWWT